nr:uncharacterized protein LOC109186495 [Ipomoea trifida]
MGNLVISHTHLNNFSSPVFVCASCLQEKLFAVILTQAQAQAEARIQQRALQEEGRKSDTNPPVLVFPRSVSPYISRRKSKSLKPDLCSDPRVSNSEGPRADMTPSSNQSWFSTIFLGRRKKQNRTFSLDEETIGVSDGYRGKKLGNVTSDKGHLQTRASSYINATLELEDVEIFSDVLSIIEDGPRPEANPHMGCQPDCPQGLSAETPISVDSPNSAVHDTASHMSCQLGANSPCENCTF